LTSQIGRDAVLSESYGRGYWYSANCLLKLSVLPEMIGLKPAQLWSRVCSTQRLILHPGLALPVFRAVPRTRPQPLQTPPVRGISMTCTPTLGPPQLPQSMNTSQTLHRAPHRISPPHLTPQHTHPEETPPVRAHSEVRRQIREQRLSLSRS
jgi:hypothetical protein